MRPLGRRTPSTFEHVERFPLSAMDLPVPPQTEKSLGLPVYWRLWDQGQEGSCVGYGTSAMTGITNTRQARLANPGSSVTLRFAPHWLYDEAQLVDEWPTTPPDEGTSVKAACDVLRVQGHRRVRYGVAGPVDLKWGITANRWATSVDEIRAAIYADLAVSFGANWYFSMDAPYIKDGERWIDIPAHNKIRGGHCFCLYRMSDRRQAFMLMNSWGAAYAPVWIPYDVVQRLLDEQGEATVITDK